MQLLNSKNGSSASSFKRASTHIPLPPSVLHACLFHPSHFFPSIAWCPCSPLSHCFTLTPHPLPALSSVHFIIPHPHSPSSFSDLYVFLPLTGKMALAIHLEKIHTNRHKHVKFSCTVNSGKKTNLIGSNQHFKCPSDKVSNNSIYSDCLNIWILHFDLIKKHPK